MSDISRTATGSIPIGIRRAGWHPQHKESLDYVIEFAQREAFSCIDLMRDGDVHAAAIRNAGLDIGAVDLAEWHDLTTEDEAARNAAIERNQAYIAACAQQGVKNFFLVVLPRDKDLPRPRNHELAALGLNALVPALEQHGARLVIEGWPGAGSVVCTPDGYRQLFLDCPSPTIGINYDPSHLVRMGIDYVRFFDEFKDRIYHVHAKDTILDEEARYNFGYEIGPADGSRRRFCGTWWRYAIPGAGLIDWTTVCEKLVSIQYDGHLSIELEDLDYHGDDPDVNEGFRRARDHLKQA